MPTVTRALARQCQLAENLQNHENISERTKGAVFKCVGVCPNRRRSGERRACSLLLIGMQMLVHAHCTSMHQPQLGH